MIEKQRIREAVFEYVKNNSSFTYGNILKGIIFYCGNDGIDELLSRKKIKCDYSKKTLNVTNGDVPGLYLFNIDELNEMLWHFIQSGIVSKNFKCMGLGDDEIFCVTDFGKKVVSDIRPSPYDYKGYIDSIKKDINNIDETIVFYLDQSLQCFNRCLYIPSAVMLGVAAEKMILIISDIAVQKLAKNDKYLKTLKDNRYQISGHKKAIDKFVLKKKMPDELSRNLDKEFNCFFELIRLSRNEAGHPSEIKLGRDDAYANFIIFRTFCKKAYKLKEWLEKQESI